MPILHRLFYIPLYAQLPADPVTPTILKTLVDAGVAVILSLAIGALAYALLQLVRNKSKDDEAENKRLTTVLEKVSSLTDAVIGINERGLQIIEGNSETQRLITTAINENTGSNRNMNSTMETMSRDLREYTSLHSDSVEQLVGAIERSESQMVAFGTALKGAIDDIHNNAKDHEEITELVRKAIDEILVIKLDIRKAFSMLTPTVQLAPPATFPTQIEVTVKPSESTAPTLSDEFPKASGE
jgi:hypothetical protein